MSQPALPEPAAKPPDIEMVHVFPWWFLLGAMALCLAFGWLLRGVWWSKWMMTGFTVLACAVLIYNRTRQQSGKLSIARYRARARIAWSAIVATLCGFTIGFFCPTATVIIDNESAGNVQILLDGEDWLTASQGDSTRRTLPAGKHRITIRDGHGTTLEEHSVEVMPYHQYVLNVLRAQAYFQGVIQYGINGGEIKMVVDPWIQIPEVDYLFRDPPAEIRSLHPVNKSFFTRRAPPKLKGR